MLKVLKVRRIQKFQRGIKFVNGQAVALLKPGWHFAWSMTGDLRIDVFSVRETQLVHKDLDVIAKSGILDDEAIVLNVADNERLLVWVEGRFDRILRPGLRVLWKAFNKVEYEIVSTEKAKFEHKALDSMIGAPELDVRYIEAGFVGFWKKNGVVQETLQPGRSVFWKDAGQISVMTVDMRETALDIVGQDIMTADKVTLRMNAILTYRIVDVLKAAIEIADARQALYREAQLALRAIVGTRELDVLLSEKDGVAAELEDTVRARAELFGVRVLALGIRDIVLPGEMKNLLNKVTEAKKSAEAALITRREETAGTRSLANTAKIYESNPTLMRLRELEALERVADKAAMTVVLGNESLVDRVANAVRIAPQPSQ